MDSNFSNLVEIERKFIVESLPSGDNYELINCSEIDQYYVSSETSEVETRVRSISLILPYRGDTNYYVTTKYKYSDNTNALARHELTFSITEDTFNSILNSGSVVRKLSKFRYEYKYENGTFTIDVFKSGLMILEVEFSSIEDSTKFNCPSDWNISREVTNLDEYKSYNLCLSEEFIMNNNEINPVNRNDNEFLSLINTPMLKTDNVIRFSGLFQISQELLSTHIVDVQFMSLRMARRLISEGEHINIGKMLEKCLVHDIDEVLVGDIPRLTKYSSTVCHDALNAVAADVVKDMSDDLDSTSYLYDLWSNAKDNTLEGYLLKLSDMIGVAKKSVTEIEILNNNNFLRIAIEMLNYVHDLQESIPVDLFFSRNSILYIKNILSGVSNSLSSIIEDRKDIINRYSIENNATKNIIDHRYRDPSEVKGSDLK